MIVFRIMLAKYADKLVASGNPARWNSKEVKVIYTAGSRALACLENVVHRNSRGLQDNFRTVLLMVPDNVKITFIGGGSLMDKWHLFQNMPYTQRLVDEWVKKGETAVLQVPSVIIQEEYNFILNPAHKDFSKIKLLSSEPFRFDERLTNR
jgi:RES domain-containing protein